MSRFKEIFSPSLTNSSIWMRIGVDVFVVFMVVVFDVSTPHLMALFWLDIIGACICYALFMSIGEHWFFRYTNVIFSLVLPLLFAPLLHFAVRDQLSPIEQENPTLLFAPYFDISLYLICIWRVQKGNFSDFLAHRRKAIIPFAAYLLTLMLLVTAFPICVRFIETKGFSPVWSTVIVLSASRTFAELMRRYQLVKARDAAPAEED